MDYVTIDFEASCLPRHGRSFPIEVGIAGDTGVQSWLIKPDTLWHDWDWTEEAFRLHGITREQLEDEGIAPEIVLSQLHRAIAGKRVIADSRIDSDWWDILGAVTDNPPVSPIEYAGDIFDEWGTPSDIIFEACQEADSLHPTRHRAADDARWLRAVLSSVREQMAAHAKTPQLRGLIGKGERVVPLHPPHIHLSSTHKELKNVA